MAQQIADKRDIDFVLYEQLSSEVLHKTKKFKGQKKSMFDMIVKEARSLAIKEILPLNKDGDRQGMQFDSKTGRVRAPKSFHKGMRLLQEGEYFAMAEDPEVGGMGLPQVIVQAALEYLIGADFAFSSMIIGCHGAGKMVELFGTQEQKELFLDKLYSGTWGGTMVLTEPEAGSDVGNLSTAAVKNADGTYSITGNKIFITGGDHDLTENIIHTVLARIEGAPAGTKGISLFLVPSTWVNQDGSLGDRNDVVCTGIEEKMGLHGSATCQLTFGGKGNCRGQLLGEANKGMQVMFHMMNEARLGIGAVGLFNASCSYLYALNYAKERIQGRDLAEMGNHAAPAVPIVNHPDVRRMLMWMKVNTEGMRSFVYYIASLFDREASTEDETERKKTAGLIDLLTPVVKSYCTDKGFEATVQAIQVYGGYGYTKDYPIERLMRDSKINSIYEGTNGIQAIDLLGRKLGMEKGAVFMHFIEEIKKTILTAQKTGLENLSKPFEHAVNTFMETAGYLGKNAMSPEFRTAFASASPFLEVMGDIIMAWMLLWRAAVSKPALEKTKKKKDAAFYEGQLQSAAYYIRSQLPVTLGKMNAIRSDDNSVIEIPLASFGG